MGRALFFVLLFFTVIAQATLLPNLVPISILPNVVLVEVLLWAAFRGTAEGVVWVFIAGVMLDALSLDPLGTNGLALLLVVLIAGQTRRRIVHSGLVIPIVLVVIGTFLYTIVLLLLRSSATGAVPVASVMRVTAATAMLNAMLVPPLYLLTAFLNRRINDGSKT